MSGNSLFVSNELISSNYVPENVRIQKRCGFYNFLLNPLTRFESILMLSSFAIGHVLCSRFIRY